MSVWSGVVDWKKYRYQKYLEKVSVSVLFKMLSTVTDGYQMYSKSSWQTEKTELVSDNQINHTTFLYVIRFYHFLYEISNT